MTAPDPPENLPRVLLVVAQLATGGAEVQLVRPCSCACGHARQRHFALFDSRPVALDHIAARIANLDVKDASLIATYQADRAEIVVESTFTD